MNPQCLIRAQGPLAVFTFPAEIDIANACRLGRELGSALGLASTIIADLTTTTFCDASGVRVLLRALDQATATGTELRLVVPSASVLRILALTGADRLLPIYPSLEDALEPGGRPPRVCSTGDGEQPRPGRRDPRAAAPRRRGAHRWSHLVADIESIAGPAE